MKHAIFAVLTLFIIFMFAGNAHAGFYASWSSQPIKFGQAKPAFTGSASAQFTFGQIKPVQWRGQAPSLNLAFQAQRAQPQGQIVGAGSVGWNIKTQTPRWPLGSGSISLGISRQLISGGAKFTSQPAMNVQAGSGFQAVKTGHSYLRIKAQPGRFVYSYNALNDP